jgi:flagellar basal-body rod protein FlgB
MFGKLDQVFSFHENALRLRAERNQLLVSNIANADTPHYKARDMDFKKAMQDAMKESGASSSESGLQMVQSNSAHMLAQTSAGVPHTFMRKPMQNNLDGNTVDVDIERNSVVQNAIQYEANVSFAQSEIKGLMAVLQG